LQRTCFPEMNRPRFGLLAVGVLILTCSLASRAASAAGPCSVGAGQPVILMSSELDPDVFVWDARQRATDYAGGYYKNANDVMVHTLISKPGTRALVVTCIHGGAQAKFTKRPIDVIGLKLLTGPDRGRYGWVTAEDVHLPQPTSALSAAKGASPQP
jgi:hypothetical protein